MKNDWMPSAAQVIGGIKAKRAALPEGDGERNVPLPIGPLTFDLMQRADEMRRVAEIRATERWLLVAIGGLFGAALAVLAMLVFLRVA
jgi:hypothetical protein